MSFEFKIYNSKFKIIINMNHIDEDSDFFGIVETNGRSSKTETTIKFTCKDCVHRQRWQTDEKSTKIFQFCAIRQSKRTQNGLLKIKCKTEACALFKNKKL